LNSIKPNPPENLQNISYSIKMNSKAPNSPTIDPALVSFDTNYKRNIKRINEPLQQNYSSPKNHEDSPPSLAEKEEALEEEKNEKEEEAQEEEEDVQQNKDGAYLFQIPGPPPEVFYPKDNMVKSVKKFAVDHGYVIVIRRSQAEKKILFKCDR
jgi:hypothetical protein